ncbi:KIAA1443, isoform CRA_c [Homo sapiens]|nr:KIAA1443, isoform CRA_c [Homo sapiens]
MVRGWEPPPGLDCVRSLLDCL